MASENCVICGRKKKDKKGNICYSCQFKKHKKRKLDWFYGVVGETCWKCGYNNGELGRKVLDFHHVNPEEKEMSLTFREVVGHSAKRVLKEAQKCCLLCCRCHREYESGITGKEDIVKIYTECWDKIKKEIIKIGYDYEDRNGYSALHPCKKCGKKLKSYPKSGLCSVCFNITKRKVERPSKEVLEKEISGNSWLSLGRKYGVSDNAVKKWAISYGIPFKKRNYHVKERPKG